VALAFVGQASDLGDAFYLFALSLLPPVFLLGSFSYLRLVQTSIEDMVYTVGSFRIREYFLGLDPAAVPFFPPTDPRGMATLERLGVVAGGPLQLLLTAASMVGCINAIVGGVAVALAVRWLLEPPVQVAAVVGVAVACGLAALCFGYQVRRFRRAAAVVPQLYEGQSPGPARLDRRGRLGPGRPPRRPVGEPSHDQPERDDHHPGQGRVPHPAPAPAAAPAARAGSRPARSGVAAAWR
jgi:hypothetical protein